MTISSTLSQVSAFGLRGKGVQKLQGFRNIAFNGPGRAAAILPGFRKH
jgi:hypothetical protein